MVKDRIVAFNELYPKGSILTEIIKNDEKSVVVLAEVCPDAEKTARVFTGHSEAFRTGNMGDVAVEVAETSAVGRALAMLGIGIIDSVASADEMKKSDTSYTVSSSYKVPKALNDKQKNLLRITIHQAGQPMPEDDWFETLDYGTFNRALAKLKSMPKVVKTFPDLPKGDEDTNIEGDKKVDYNQDTGELL